MSDTAADRFRTAAERFSTLVGGTTDWSAPTPVDQWRARDVVEHLGTLPLERLVDTYYTPDVVMHSWDLARSSGQDDTIDPAFVRDAHAGMLSMEPMIRGSGQYGEQQPEPEGASEQERFLAFIGRDPRWSSPT
ncbi:hypothetical protein M3697_16040 [Janibacter melonis]|uniref:maleylpyruvate isomerase N-terminal domain-containing protein n=1 Tax=Janibacter melonis TaxID=262209 RepID=UPI002043A0C0|nr:maleylpyruvate isomerase N-terminal domain-containing protein [Janibacter melonis]MCM3556597.1 hypothetical protein [Janibacter melonis]